MPLFITATIREIRGKPAIPRIRLYFITTMRRDIDLPSASRR
jgi:hypothetical protein